MKRTLIRSLFSVFLSACLIFSLLSASAYFILDRSDEYDESLAEPVDPDFISLDVYQKQLELLGDSYAGRYVTTNEKGQFLL